MRPEFLTLHDRGGGDRVQVAVTGVEDLGNYRIVSARLGDDAVKVKLDEETIPPAGAAWLGFPPEQTLLYRDGALEEPAR